MKNALVYIAGLVVWSAACFFAFVVTVFMGFPKTREDLIEMGYTTFHFYLPNIVIAIWIIAPIIFFIIRHLQKRRDDYWNNQ